MLTRNLGLLTNQMEKEKTKDFKNALKNHSKINRAFLRKVSTGHLVAEAVRLRDKTTKGKIQVEITKQ